MPYLPTGRPQALARSRVFFELGCVHPCGREIGRLGDHPIFDVVEDKHGRRYRYSGVAPLGVAGFDPAALRSGEFIVARRLIYRLLPTP